MSANKINLDTPLHLLKPLSASSIKKFSDCPKSYEFYKLKSPEESRGSQLILGSAVHSAIEGFYKKHPKYATPQLAAKKFEGWYRHGEIEAKEAGLKVKYPTYGNRNKDIREGALMVEGFLEHYKNLKVVEAEAGFLGAVPLLTGKTIQLEGFIDLVIEEEDGSLTLADIKTGFSKPTNIYLNYDIQMNGYRFIVRYGEQIEGRNNYKKVNTKFDINKVQRKRIYNVREFSHKDIDLKKVEYTDDSFDEDEFIKIMTYYVSGMETCHDTGYYPRLVGAIHSGPCSWCDYVNICKKT